ncbi:MAG: SRPBCC domain-containing protein [Maricaulaceae bacterium]|nr:SRPBCC domain-containing protein [Maricaulaceae bacterium]
MRLLIAFCLALAAPAALADDPPPAERAVTASVIAEAPVAEVWALWTTEAGFTSFFSPAARIELRPQGPFEAYFLPDAAPGQRGSEDTIILGFQEERMLSATWALPPYMAEVRPHHTHLLIRFEPLDEDRTRVTLTHSGWGEGEAWDTAFAYFERVWPHVLDAMRRRAEGEEVR